ncbi:lactosylceramide -n-acetyl-beta-d-glucosaminyltransferase [Biomphalaria glabrata]
MAAQALKDFDIESLHTPKAFLFHTLLSCFLDAVTPKGQTGVQATSDSKSKHWIQLLDINTLREMVYKYEADADKAKSVIRFLSQPIINDHNFSYIHNPKETCARRDIDVLFVVPSAPEYFSRRERNRKGGLYQFTLDRNNKARLLFFIGKPEKDSANVQAKIDEEIALYGDIVQENFNDIYKNIRLKAVSMLRWASTFCEKVKFVIRADDDIDFNIVNALQVMEEKRAFYTDFILGVRKDDYKPEREVTNKWYLSTNEYPSTHLPPFALGALLGYPLSTVTLLYQAALRVEPIWLDDVFITGICAPKVGIPVFKHPKFDFIHNS